MGKSISLFEANILGCIKHFAERGTSREDLQPFLDKLKTKYCKKLAESYISQAEAARNTSIAMQSAQKAVRKAYKKRKVRTKPLRVLGDPEYRKLNQEYKARTGRWFKRTRQEMRNRMSKLEAIKYRIDLMDKGKMAAQEALRKTDPEFHLGGAL